MNREILITYLTSVHTLLPIGIILIFIENDQSDSDINWLKI